jgi:hypothetical protein
MTGMAADGDQVPVAAEASADCVSCEHARDAAGLLQWSAEAMGGAGGAADVERGRGGQRKKERC